MHETTMPFGTTRISAIKLCAAVAMAASLPLAGSSAEAQQAHACIDEMPDEAVTYRLNKIEKVFADGRNKSMNWRIGWSLGYVAVGAGLTALAVQASRETGDRSADRFAFAYGAAGAFAQAIRTVALPMPGAWGLKRIRRMPTDTLEQRRAKLRYATEKLEQGAKIENVLGGAATVGLGVIYGVVGGSVKAAKWSVTPGFTALVFLGPPTLATISVVTAPSHLKEGWEEYRSVACSEQYFERREKLDLDLDFTPQGVTFSLRF